MLRVVRYLSLSLMLSFASGKALASDPVTSDHGIILDGPEALRVTGKHVADRAVEELINCRGYAIAYEEQDSPTSPARTGSVVFPLRVEHDAEAAARALIDSLPLPIRGSYEVQRTSGGYVILGERSQAGRSLLDTPISLTVRAAPFLDAFEAWRLALEGASGVRVEFGFPPKGIPGTMVTVDMPFAPAREVLVTLLEQSSTSPRVWSLTVFAPGRYDLDLRNSYARPELCAYDAYPAVLP